MRAPFKTLGAAAALWAAALLLSLAFRPLFPVDETRYVSVAWEMWVRGDFLVPHLNGELYGHKPPLLFWLMQAGWWLFGVNEWWPRLVPALFALGNLVFCVFLARRLWPDRPSAGPLAALVLSSSVLYFVFTGLVMFDMLVAFFTLAGVTGVLLAAQYEGWRGWLLAGVAIGLGILAKGPVILLHVLPVALLMPWWRSRDTVPVGARWYLGVLGTIAIGSVIALAWALAAANSGGEAYAQEIFWSQTADRVVESFAHRRSWWWYLPILPLALLPWSFWPPLLRTLPRMRRISDPGVRFILAWILPSFAALSLVSGKNANYLLPLLPGVALLAACLLLAAEPGEARSGRRIPGSILILGGIALFALRQGAETKGALQPFAGLPLWPGVALALGGLTAMVFPPRPGPRSVAAAMLVVYTVIFVAGVRHIAPAYDMRPVAQNLARLESSGIPVAHVGKYYGEFHFLGRLERPLFRIEPAEVNSWFERHPRGRVVALATMWEPEDGRQPEFRKSYRSNTISIWTKGTDSGR